MKSTIGLILALNMILTACQPAPAIADVPPLSSPEPVDTVEEPLSAPQVDSTFTPAQEIAVQISKSNLSRHLDIGIDQIKVVSVAGVTWPDTSLGCPQPDTVYAQVLTPGCVIQLQANGQTYTYHSDMNGTIVECGEPEFPVAPGEIQDGQPWMPVP